MVYLLKVVGIPLDFIGKPFTDQRLKISIEKNERTYHCAPDCSSMFAHYITPLNFYFGDI